VENKRTGGDVTRSWKLPSEDRQDPVSAYFSSVNYNKKHLFLNLSESDHINKVYRLLKDADVVISNFKYGDDFKFGLDYERVKTINPKIIYAQLTGFESIPERVAYDVVVQAECGYMFMNGTPESAPLKMPLAMMDVLAAHQLREGILTALWQKERDGKGRHVKCSLEASGLSSLINQASNYLMAGHVPQPMGSLHPNIAPYGETFQCKDGKSIVLAIGTDKHFRKLCVLLGMEGLADEEHFQTNAARVVNRQALQQKLTPLFQRFERDAIIEQCIAQNIPAGAVKSMDEVMESSTAKGMILEQELEGITTRRMSTIAFTIN
jgi:crotonobetainyl-CoA:carnitine CoA-transferase CaiB-like acyl-CoA transferase